MNLWRDVKLGRDIRGRRRGTVVLSHCPMIFSKENGAAPSAHRPLPARKQEADTNGKDT